MEWQQVFGRSQRLTIIGHRHCPYTLKATQLASRHFPNAYDVIVFDGSNSAPFQTAQQFRMQTNYNGTFPIVFHHPIPTYIGGADDLERALGQ